MPFKSEKQRRFLWLKHPKLAKEWSKKYGSKPMKSKLAGHMGREDGIKCATEIGAPLYAATAAGALALGSGLGLAAGHLVNTNPVSLGVVRKKELVSRLDEAIAEVKARTALSKIKRKNI